MTTVDWTKLPDDVAFEVFSCLNSCDRASLASTCRSWRNLGSSPYLWHTLDLRFHHNFNSVTVFSLAAHCANLQKLQFKGNNVNNAIINLQANNLKEIKGSEIQNFQSTLSAITGRHPHLESLELMAYNKRTIVDIDEIQALALCCPKLKNLQISRANCISGDAIDALYMHCCNFSEIKLTDCHGIDEMALGKFSSLRFLSVAGTVGINWDLVCEYWPKLPNLIGVDISRTNVSSEIISRLLLSSSSLKVLSALKCPALFLQSVNNKKNVKLLADYTNVYQLFRIVIPKSGRGLYTGKVKDEDEIMTWLENITSCVLLDDVSQNNSMLQSDFWKSDFGQLILHLMLSPQKDVQEMITRVFAKMKIDDKWGKKKVICFNRVRPIPQYHDKALCFLLDLAKSQHEGLQFEATKAIINFCRYPSTWEAVVKRGGVSIFMILLRSSIRSVAEEAAQGLSILVSERKNEDAKFKAGCREALLVIMTGGFKIGKRVLDVLLLSLANLTTDEICGRNIARAGDLQALVKLGLEFNSEVVLNQVVWAIANILFGRESDRVPFDTKKLCDILIQLTHCKFSKVREEADAVLLKLCDDEKYIEVLPTAAAAYVIKFLLLQRTYGFEERVARGFWKLSVSTANSIAISQQGGVASLVALARSTDAKVQEYAAGALGNLVFYKCIDNHKEVEVVSTLSRACATSVTDSVRFTAALTLAYIFHERIDDREILGTLLGRKLRRTGAQHEAKKMTLNPIKVFIHSICDQKKFLAASVSMPLQGLLEIAKTVYIPDASCTYCSGPKIKRLLAMLGDKSFALVAIAAFAIFQFTSPNDKRSKYHRELLQEAGGVQIIHDKAVSNSSQEIVNVLCRLVLINLDA